jgi:Glycogen recognition site of AMP-activated protein kinase
MQGARWLLFLALVLVVSPARGSGQGWVVDASAGEAEYEALAGDVGSVSAILAVRYEGTRWGVLMGGVPLDSAGLPWASAGVGGRWSRGVTGVEVGIDLGAVGYGYRISELEATGGGASLIGLPFLGVTRGPGRVELRSGLLHHRTWFDGGSEWRTVHDSGLRGTVFLGTRAVLEAEGRLVRASEGDYPYAGMRAELLLGRGTVWLRGGRWMADELDDTEWSVGGSVDVTRRLAVRAAYERQADDPLYWNGARSGWTIGVAHFFGRRPGGALLLPPPESFRAEPGRITLRLPLEEAEQPPSIAGDFTEWQPVAMQRSEEHWEASFELAPGVYHYSFVRGDGTWFVPPSMPNQVDDGFGGRNAVLVVGS